MKHCLYSFLSRLALPGLMSLFLLAPAIARAEIFAISVDFRDGFTGTGSFLTENETCDPCSALSFVFTVDDDTFTPPPSQLQSFRALNVIESVGPLHGGDDVAEDTLSFHTVSPVLVAFVDADDAPSDAVGIQTISAVPEPTSLVLLAGGIGLLVIGLTRRRSARMRGGIR